MKFSCDRSIVPRLLQSPLVMQDQLAPSECLATSTRRTLKTQVPGSDGESFVNVMGINKFLWKDMLNRHSKVEKNV